MSTVTLNDGVIAPQLGFGTWKLRGDDATRMVAQAIVAGYRHIDTAAIYRNETEVGRGIADSGAARNEIFVTTKLWNDSHKAQDARRAIETSLDKLGLDHVDLYLVHWPTLASDYVEAWESLIEFREEGLTRSIGVSNFLPRHLNAITSATDIVPSVNQIEVHPTFTPVPLLATNKLLGIATGAWSPLGLAADLELPGVLALAEEFGRSPAQIVLRWHLQLGHIPIPKTATPSRLVENLDVFDFELSSDQIARISGLDSGHRMGPDPEAFDGS